jgi:hypothetical protein
LRSDATVKTITPMMKRRLRPTKSAARPPSSRKPPKASVYAFTTHCSELAEKSRSSWIEGSATFTTVASSTTMNWAMHTSTRTSHLLGTLRGGAVLTRRLRAGRFADPDAAVRFGNLDQPESPVHFDPAPLSEPLPNGEGA